MNSGNPHLLRLKQGRFALDVSTAILITFAASFVLLQLSIRFGSTVSDFAELTLY